MTSPSPRSDDDTYELIDDALAWLASRPVKRWVFAAGRVTRALPGCCPGLFPG